MPGQVLPVPRRGLGSFSAASSPKGRRRSGASGVLPGCRPPAAGGPRKALEDDGRHSQCSTKGSTSCGDRQSIGTLPGDLPSCPASPCATEDSCGSPFASVSGHPEALLTDWALKDFNIIKTVGKGFLGSVRYVELANDGTPFALKVMKKSVVLKKRQVSHTMQERQLLGQVDNPFIVKLRAAFQDSANLYLLMEFVNGGELFSAISRGCTFKNDGAKFYASEITLALGHCHSKSIAYRDLKLENILVDRSGHVKITDFGFAKVVRRTLTYTLCGTPDYQAPEIILGHGHDVSVDWWALGILIFELLTGKTPFGASDSNAIYRKTLFAEPSYPCFFTANSRNIIGRFLTKDKHFRLGTGSNGVGDVKSHPWFAMVDFDLVLQKQYLPPYLPTVNSDSDTCMFDPWPEEDISCDEPNDLSVEQQHLFRDF